MAQYPFEANFSEPQANLDHYVDVILASLESDFLIRPTMKNFLKYQTFETGYEALKQATKSFHNLDPKTVRSENRSIRLATNSHLREWRWKIDG
ncbi:MAG: hypothetical protein LBT38_06875 [Deltaproteobacteria bacterium]|jgi:hypothetical protein|nr:hypothetical protein [Deltaproteobacteria bacterium]